MNEPILLTGATGYVGGRLLHALERRGHAVRCLSRRPEALVGRVGRNTPVVAADVLDPSSLRHALAGVGSAYYLVHSMGGGNSFASADREGAANVAATARSVSGETEARATQMRVDWRIQRVRLSYGLSEEQMREWGLFVSPGISEAEPPLFTARVVPAEAQRDGLLRLVAFHAGGRPRLDELLGGIDYWAAPGYPARGEA